jgi:hypothetical protein
LDLLVFGASLRLLYLEAAAVALPNGIAVFLAALLIVVRDSSNRRVEEDTAPFVENLLLQGL